MISGRPENIHSIAMLRDERHHVADLPEYARRKRRAKYSSRICKRSGMRRDFPSEGDSIDELVHIAC
jgi:hypothetical protein